MKIFTIFLVVCLFLAAFALSNWTAECMKRSFDWAVPTAQGVMCYIDNSALVHRYMLLRDVIEREKAEPTPTLPSPKRQEQGRHLGEEERQRIMI